MLVNLISEIHKSTPRDYLGRMSKDKPDCMEKAREFGFDFWDGERKYGYGGYKDDGRWVLVAERIVNRYKLNSTTSVLDIGCGKGYLANEIRKITNSYVSGYDISAYALMQNPLKNKSRFVAGKDCLNESFDLIISLNTLHNLILPELKQAIRQIVLHSKNSYIVVESYRNTKELHNLQCWALTCEQFLRPEEWEFLFNEWGYTGDHEFIFFE